MNNTLKDILDSPVRMSMRRDPVKVSPLEPISGITFMMISEDIGAVIVVERGRPVGIITEKDILERVVAPGEDVYKTLARDVMSKPLISVVASTPLKEALEIMRKRKIRRLAITENNSLVGLITERRLLASIGNLIV